MGKLSKLKLKKQSEAQQEALMLELLRKKKEIHKDPKQLLHKILAGEVFSNDVPYYSSWFLIIENLEKGNKHSENFVKILKALVKHRGRALLEDADFVRGLWHIAEYAEKWFTEPCQWKPQSRNAEKLFGELLRHLFAPYYVPTFLDKSWIRGAKKYIDWFLHIGSGQNIRTAKQLPLKFTKKMAHQFLKAPAHYDVPEAIRWAQITAMGGEKRLVPYILATRIGQGFAHEEFVETVIRFFIQNPMLDPVHIQPMVEYIFTQKFETRQLVVARGVYETLPPAQPDFSMKGRTAYSLLRQVEEWHRVLAMEKKRMGLATWKPLAVNDFVWHQPPQYDWESGKIYRITQLLTSRELFQEGRAMNHCVGTYVNSCMKGNTSIWSLTVEEDFQKPARLVTIELDKHLNFQQIRGKYNAWATAEAIEVIRHWSNQAGLRFPHWLSTS